MKKQQPIVIAHRGASAYMPEHTLAAYSLAIFQGADFIEPDLVMSKDGVMVARHDNELGLSTDVAEREEFASRRRTNTVDGAAIDGWFTEDFTLAELKTLRCRERIPSIRPRNEQFNGHFPIATLDEILLLRNRLQAMVQRPLGVYPEIKHPSHFQALGLDMEKPLVDKLHAAGFRGHEAMVYIQSFEIDNLKYLRSITDLPLLQLLWLEGKPFDQTGISYDEMASAEGLREIAGYATAVGPEKNHFILRADADGNLDHTRATSFVEDAHSADLQVHPYTFRPENEFLPGALQEGKNPAMCGDMLTELQVFLALGIDGFFTDAPDLGRQAIDRFCPKVTD
jgi:glycerophosphoryl diester phosphodiesterase